MTIKLIPQKGPKGYPAGKAVVIFKGLVRTGGIYNDTSVPGARSQRA